MKIVLFGFGSIGQRHARLLQEGKHELYAFRSSKNSPENTLGIPEITDFESVEKLNPDIAFITNPTSEHIRTAMKCAKHGINLFIEKPLGHTRSGLEELKQVVQEKELNAYVAYCLRFHPLIKRLKELLEGETPRKVSVIVTSNLAEWRPGVDSKETYSAKKELGGGVILDLSHEIDYIYYLLGKPENVSATAEKKGNVTIDAEDTADIIFLYKEFECTLHLDFANTEEKREIIVELNNETLIANLRDGKLRHNTQDIEEEHAIERDDLFRKQLNHYFTSSKGMLSAEWEEALEVYELIMQIKDQTEQSTTKSNEETT